MSSIAEQAIAALEAAGLGEVVYRPADEAYDRRIRSYWSLSSQLRPWALVQPRNTHEVSLAVKALVDTPDCKFAVRSGGHMQWPGANNIEDGVTIDLGLMASTTYDEKTQLASLQPGGRWTEVYQELEKYGRMVAGGREGQVGVGGLLLGGGKTFYTCRVGFACDQVVKYEVVLADGRVIEASADAHADLFVALKGGGNNFGVVTRFDMATFAARDMWDGTVVYAPSATPRLVEAFVGFARGLAQRPDSHILAMWNLPPGAEDHMVIGVLSGLDGEPETASLAGFLAIEGQRDMKIQSVGTKLASFIVPSGKHDTWFTTTFALDARVVAKCASVFEATKARLAAAIPENGASNFSMSMVLQPLLASFAREGNVLGIPGPAGDGDGGDAYVLLVWAVETETAAQTSEHGWRLLRDAVAEIDAFAAELGTACPFRYLNYADASQDPLGSYGAANVRRVRDAAAAYDPAGVFQTRVPGGFKISKVREN